MSPESLNGEIARIRNIISCEGSCMMTAKQLFGLCSDEGVAAQFRFLVKLALEEKWAFSFLPDERLQITPLPEKSSDDVLAAHAA